VDDLGDVLERAPAGVGVADVAADELEVGAVPHGEERGHRAVEQAVEHANAPARVEELLDEHRADIPGPTGYQCHVARHVSPCLRVESVEAAPARITRARDRDRFRPNRVAT
jgi:hypothetical protein